MPQADRAADEIRTRGFTIIERALSAGEVAELAAGVDRVLAALATPFGANEFLGFRTRRVFNLLARDALFEGLPMHAALLPLA